MTNLIIGKGEVGNALFRILGGWVIDKNELGTMGFDIIHICFPYSDEFESEVRRYQDYYKPKYTIIHSTVPVGTSRKLNAIHSPIRGIHPNLDAGIRTFVKFIGGKKASEIADVFRRAGIKVMLFDTKTTEAMKLWDTSIIKLALNRT